MTKIDYMPIGKVDERPSKRWIKAEDAMFLIYSLIYLLGAMTGAVIVAAMLL